MHGTGDASTPKDGLTAQSAAASPKPGAAGALLGLEALASTLDHATTNMSIAALDSLRSAAAKPEAADAADAAQRLAVHLVQQMKGLEVALAEVNPARR